MAISADSPTYTILEADGQYPDNILEDRIFNESPGHPYKIHFLRTSLAPVGTAYLKPWTEIPKEIRDEVDGLMILKLYLTAEDVELFPKLKVVVRMGLPDYGTEDVADHAVAAALRAKAFGWNVLFHDPYLPNGADKSIGVERTKDIKELFRRSSIISVHCPATRETRGLVNYDLLSILPRGAVLVNTARGEIVDLDSVERCLRENILAGAGLDVLPTEPIEEPAHSLIQAYRRKEDWLTGRLVLTCHTAFYSPSSLQEIREKSAQTMREVLIDRLKSNVITPDME
ncbi:hypothetical protein LTR36_010672 [Oleoguttula mirabilis]|uniref:D-isomer specific 2-hydroxyacid dehydrogenase NAD-binding domain-containing protein n=1 Tax=Oleoguttula mirabilis TaxID=1507867 RepID=A0AAV9JSD3_9PEZI|nr:hypothetical protein LTR36_010672 [Oleoguttula mirabilis]